MKNIPCHQVVYHLLSTLKAYTIREHFHALEAWDSNFWTILPVPAIHWSSTDYPPSSMRVCLPGSDWKSRPPNPTVAPHISWLPYYVHHLKNAYVNILMKAIQTWKKIDMWFITIVKVGFYSSLLTKGYYVYTYVYLHMTYDISLVLPQTWRTQFWGIYSHPFYSNSQVFSYQNVSFSSIYSPFYKYIPSHFFTRLAPGCLSALAAGLTHGTIVLDACAAPGSKTSHAIELLGGSSRPRKHFHVKPGLLMVY